MTAKAKRAVIGFKGLALAPVITDTLLAYATGPAKELPYAGSMNVTAKESSTDLFYDDDLYFQVKDVTGADVEIRVAEADFAQLADMGFGNWDEAAQTFESDYSVAGRDYSLRYCTNTVSGLPFYWRERVFQLNGMKFDNFASKKDGVTICEVILTGVMKRPRMAGLLPRAVMQLKEDRSNESACAAFLAAAETKPVL